MCPETLKVFLLPQHLFSFFYISQSFFLLKENSLQSYYQTDFLKDQ